jgi:hypothetical protein
MSNLSGIERSRLAIRIAAMRTADSLSRLYGADPSIKTWSSKSGKMREYDVVPVPLSPALWPVIDADTLTWHRDDPACFFMPDDGAEPALWPIKCGAVFSTGNGGGILAIVETISLAEVRGRVRLFGRHMVKVASIEFDGGSRIVNSGSGILVRRGANWIDARGPSVSMPHFGHSQQPVSVMPSLIIGHALRQRYEWSSVFHFPTGLRLRFGCTADAVLDLFRDRDKRNGDDRRRALLHWVRRHWRKTRFTQSDASSEVRKHMRGQTVVNWRGMDVTIVPAMYDVETDASPALGDVRIVRGG